MSFFSSCFCACIKQRVHIAKHIQYKKALNAVGLSFLSIDCPSPTRQFNMIVVVFGLIFFYCLHLFTTHKMSPTIVCYVYDHELWKRLMSMIMIMDNCVFVSVLLNFCFVFMFGVPISVVCHHLSSIFLLLAVYFCYSSCISATRRDYTPGCCYVMSVVCCLCMLHLCLSLLRCCM